jgi:DNA-binding response OmpR family regulator
VAVPLPRDARIVESMTVRAAYDDRPATGPGAPLRVLVVDDEAPLLALVGSYLARAGFEVSAAADGPSAVRAAREVDPDVVVLDVGLPGLDGLEVCRALREFSDCYVLMLTARSEEADTIAGLAAGADDYLTKPFSPRELVARVQVLLRRPRRVAAPVPSRAGPDPLVVGPLRIDPSARDVTLDGATVPLTRTEFDVLAALAAEPGRAYTRAALIATVWGDGWYGDEHLVDVHVAHLRRKLGDDPASPRFVRTVRGIGYRLGDGQ